MKKIAFISRIVAVATTVCMMVSNQPWMYAAASLKHDSELDKQYLSDVKMFYGAIDTDVRKACEKEGYTFCSTNFNSNTNTVIGAYMGYKTTDDPDKAITDISLLDMKNSHYELMTYKEFLESHVSEFNSQAEEVMTLVSDFRRKYEKGSPNALAAYDSLNLIYIDASGSTDDPNNLLGNYLLYKADASFFAKFIQRGNAKVLSKIVDILGTATADYNPDHSTWVERSKVSELPVALANADSATLNSYRSSFEDPANTLIQSIQNFGEVYTKAKYLYDTYGETFGYDETYGLSNDSTMADLNAAGPDCLLPEYAQAMQTYTLLNSYVYHRAGETVVTNASLFESESDDEANDSEATIVYTEDKTLAQYFLELAEDESLSEHPERVYPLVQGMTAAQRTTLKLCGLYKLVSGLYPAEEYLQKRDNVIQEAMQHLRDSGCESGKLYLWTGSDTTLLTKRVAETSALIERNASSAEAKSALDEASRNENSILEEALNWVEISTLVYSGVFMIATAIVGASLWGLGTAALSMASFALSAGLVGSSIMIGLAGVALCALYVLNIVAIVISLALLIYNILDWTGVLETRDEISYEEIPEIVFNAHTDGDGNIWRVRYDSVPSNASMDILDEDDGFGEREIDEDSEFLNGAFADVNAFQSEYDRWITIYKTKTFEAGSPIEIIPGKEPFIAQSSYQAPEGYRPLTLFNNLHGTNINDVEVNDKTGAPLYIFFPGDANVMASGTITDSDQYVTDVRMASASSKSEAINTLKKEQYEVIDVNLTPGMAETYIGYQLGSNEDNALTDLRFSTAGVQQLVFGEASYARAGVSGYEKTPDGISLYKTASKAAGTPITKLSVETERLELGCGAEPVCLFSGGNAVDISEKWSDHYLFLEDTADGLYHDESFFIKGSGGYESVLNSKVNSYEFVRQGTPDKGIFLYFWPKEQFLAEDEAGNSNTSYIGGFSYFLAAEKNVVKYPYDSDNYKYMQTFAKENGFELIEENGTPMRIMTDSAGEMTLSTRWRDVGGGALDTYNYDQVHSIIKGYPVANSDGGLKSFTMTGSAGYLDKNTTREREPHMIYHTAMYFGVSTTYNPYRAITGISALMTSYTETTHQIKYNGITTPAGNMLPCNVSVQGNPITAAGISSSYYNINNMTYPLYTNYTARQCSDMDWMTKEPTEIQSRYLLTAGPKEGMLPIKQDEVMFVTSEDHGTYDDYVPLCDMRIPGDYEHPFNLALDTSNCGSKYLYLYINNSAGGRAGSNKNSGHNVYHAKKYVAAVFCGVGKTPEEAIADLYSQANKQWGAISNAFSDIPSKPLVTEFDEIIPLDISSNNPWYDLHCNNVDVVKSLKNGEWVRGNDAAYYRWEGHDRTDYGDKAIDEYEQTQNCAYVGVVRTNKASGVGRNAVYGLVKYYDNSDAPSSTLKVGSTECILAGGPVISPEGKYSLYYSANSGTAAYSAPVTSIKIDDSIFTNGYNTSVAVSSSQRVNGALPEYPSLRMRADEYKYFHLAYDRVDLPYIESLYIGVGRNRQEAYADLIGTTNAYGAIDVNCNNNSYSDKYIVIGYRRTKTKSKAIRDLFLYYGDAPTTDQFSINIADGYISKTSKNVLTFTPNTTEAGATYKLIRHNLASGSEVCSLSEGNGGKGLYLYYTTENVTIKQDPATEIFPITNICLSYGDINPKFATAQDLADIYQNSYFKNVKVDSSAFENPRWENVIGVEKDPSLWKIDGSAGRRMSLNEGVLPGRGDNGWHAADNRVYMYVDRDPLKAIGAKEKEDYTIRPNAALTDQGYYSATTQYGILKQVS